MNSDQVKVIVDQYHIYLLSSGRISIAGLNDGNVAYVANAFHQATKNSNIWKHYKYLYIYHVNIFYHHNKNSKINKSYPSPYKTKNTF